jgi:hypothetical protein
MTSAGAAPKLTMSARLSYSAPNASLRAREARDAPVQAVEHHRDHDRDGRVVEVHVHRLHDRVEAREQRSAS